MADYNSITYQRIQITTVDPSNRSVEGILKDRAPIRVAIWSAGPFFRWPKVGEVWSIRYSGTNWYLHEYVSSGSTEVDKAIDDVIEGSGVITVPSGELHISTGTEAQGARIVADGPLSLRSSSNDFGIILGSGKRMNIVGKCIYDIGAASPTTIYTIKHEMNTLDILFTLRKKSDGTIITTGYTPVILDKDQLRLTFTVAPTLNSLSLTIIG